MPACLIANGYMGTLAALSSAVQQDLYYTLSGPEWFAHRPMGTLQDSHLQVDSLQVFPEVACILVTIEHHLEARRRLQEVQLVVAGAEGVKAARLANAQRRAHRRLAG